METECSCILTLFDVTTRSAAQTPWHESLLSNWSRPSLTPGARVLPNSRFTQLRQYLLAANTRTEQKRTTEEETTVSNYFTEDITITITCAYVRSACKFSQHCAQTTASERDTLPLHYCGRRSRLCLPTSRMLGNNCSVCWPTASPGRLQGRIPSPSPTFPPLPTTPHATKYTFLGVVANLCALKCTERAQKLRRCFYTVAVTHYVITTLTKYKVWRKSDLSRRR